MSTPGAVQAALRALSGSRFFAGIALRAMVFDLKQVHRYLSDPGVRAQARARVWAAIRGGHPGGGGPLAGVGGGLRGAVRAAWHEVQALITPPAARSANPSRATRSTSLVQVTGPPEHVLMPSVPVIREPLRSGFDA
ncbi:hypothetical protein GCM10010129_79880 [Streptomyces fumigatiscleroticus]|nr:hypothetical protein GCM10010129_79880 [Streptomyces fumigatiscleroticus]